MTIGADAHKKTKYRIDIFFPHLIDGYIRECVTHVIIQFCSKFMVIPRGAQDAPSQEDYRRMWWREPFC